MENDWNNRLDWAVESLMTETGWSREKVLREIVRSITGSNSFDKIDRLRASASFMSDTITDVPSATHAFDFTPEERAALAESMAAACKSLSSIDYKILSVALADIGNALIASLTPDLCERLAAAKREGRRP